MQRLQDRIAVITGAGSGIGLASLHRLAAEGATVVAVDVDEAAGKRAADEAGGLFVHADVTEEDAVREMYQQVVDAYGAVHIAFNNAGIEGAWIPIVDQSEEAWDSTININLKGVWLCLKYEIQRMLKQGAGGAIVNMSSVAGFIGSAGAATYCATKHGVIGLTKGAALETATKGIRVNAICPAVIETPMGERLFGAEEIKKFSLGLHPIGRFGRPMEVAEAVLWMCSERASFMTGQSLVLDGGFLAGPNVPG